MWSRSFWIDAAERAIATAAEVTIAYLATVAIVDDFEAGWETGLLTIGLATVTSLLKSVAATKVGSSGNASLVK